MSTPNPCKGCAGFLSASDAASRAKPVRKSCYALQRSYGTPDCSRPHGFEAGQIRAVQQFHGLFLCSVKTARHRQSSTKITLVHPEITSQIEVHYFAGAHGSIHVAKIRERFKER
jgi:hypothetical protein